MSLRKKTDYSRYVFENVGAPMLIADENMNIIMANDCAKDFFGISDEDEIVFHELFEITKEDARNYFSCSISGFDNDSCQLVARNNNAICEVSTNTILDKKKQPVCIVILITDKTEEFATMDNLKNLKTVLEQQLSDKNAQLKSMTFQTMTTLANFIDSKDEYTIGHSSRVASYASNIATELGWTEDEVKNIYYMGLLHDVGKIGIPHSVLNKPSTLDEEEYENVKKHTVLGAEILKDIKSIGNICAGALYHHEHYDGSGYPSGIKGEEIPLVARIIGIADAFDAMTSHRQYKKEQDIDSVINEIRNGAGSQFDPYLSEVVIRMIENHSLEIIYVDQSYQGADILSESSRLMAKIIGNELNKTRAEAETDYLTQIWNRGTGEKHITEYLKLGDGALAIIDLDNFKRINDTYGHECGDEALKLVADVLKMHSKNDFLCRMGGDEFMIFIRDVTNVEEVKKILDSIVLTYNSKVETLEVLSHTSLSIGVAMSVAEGRDFKKLFRGADRALYYVKQNGKRGYSFHNRAELASFENEKQLLDIERLANSIKNNINYIGAYRVEYRQFMHTHEFIEKYAMRNNQSVQLVLLTIDYEHSAPLNHIEKEEVIEALEKAVTNSLRGVDVSTRFSTAQMLLTLVDTAESNITMIIRRILKEFYHVYSADRIIIKYETADITMKAS